MGRRFVSYLRVSTSKQGALGLGIEAQRKSVEDYLNGGRWELVAELSLRSSSSSAGSSPTRSLRVS
jgi:DNA invertase Pin-like site-specific DNA recombinase